MDVFRQGWGRRVVGERICKEKAKKNCWIFSQSRKNQFGHISPKIQTKVGFRRRKRALLLNLCSVRLNLLQKELVCNYEKKTREPCKASKHHYTCAQKYWSLTIIRLQVFEYRYLLALAYPGLQEKQHVSFFAENSKSKPVCYY